MAISIFKILHLLDSITEYLTYQELLCCTLVSKHWNCVFSPILWKELYTYYSNPECCEYWNYSCYFTTIESRNALLRNCADIRTLKVRNNNVLRILRGTTCINLVELHYTAEVDVSGDLGLDSLMDLMECNPNIRALALRKIKIGEERLDQEVKEFLKFLCLYSPSLTSIDIQFEGKNSYKMEAYIILNLLKYKQNVTIQSIDNCKKESASKIQKMVREVHQLINDYGEEPFEVRNLNLKLPFKNCVSSVILALLKKCTKIQSLYLPLSCEWLKEVAWETFPSLQHLYLSHYFSDSTWESIIKSCRSLVSLELRTTLSDPTVYRPSAFWYFRTRLSPSIIQTLSRHSATLKHLDINSSRIGVGGDLSALALCPNLETFKYFNIHTTPSDILKMPNWTCLGLKTLRIEVIFDDRGGHHPVRVTDDCLDSWVMEISEARHQLLEQIGRLINLRSLTIVQGAWSYYANKIEGITPYIAKTSLDHTISYIGLGHGLELLSGLENLVEFVMQGVYEIFPCGNIDWMVEHWPKLEVLTQCINPLNPMPKDLKSKLDSNDITEDIDWVAELKRKKPNLIISITGTFLHSRSIGPEDRYYRSNKCGFYCDEWDEWDDLYDGERKEFFMNRVELFEDQYSNYIY
ncbi:hypothetical protein BGZ76_008823 [Entomortierella beljakovae]|nr:hypothetical protein BGZ76_008823 [Entomortierella beljakovae]